MPELDLSPSGVFEGMGDLLGRLLAAPIEGAASLFGTAVDVQKGIIVKVFDGLVLVLTKLLPVGIAFAIGAGLIAGTFLLLFFLGLKLFGDVL